MLISDWSSDVCSSDLCCERRRCLPRAGLRSIRNLVAAAERKAGADFPLEPGVGEQAERERQRGEGAYPRQHAAARPCPDAGIGLAHLTRLTGHVVPLLPASHVSDPARLTAAWPPAAPMPPQLVPRKAP